MHTAATSDAVTLSTHAIERLKGCEHWRVGMSLSKEMKMAKKCHAQSKALGMPLAPGSGKIRFELFIWSQHAARKKA
jgi:hypothetical protein